METIFVIKYLAHAPMKFVYKGKIKLGRTSQSFEKRIEASSKALATEKLYNLLGSSHRAHRNQIEIEEVEKTESE